MISKTKHEIGNLLAIIHGDGGHYVNEHGWVKACVDAIAIVTALRVKVDQLEYEAGAAVPIDVWAPLER